MLEAGKFNNKTAQEIFSDFYKELYERLGISTSDDDLKATIKYVN